VVTRPLPCARGSKPMPRGNVVLRGDPRRRSLALACGGPLENVKRSRKYAPALSQHRGDAIVAALGVDEIDQATDIDRVVRRIDDTSRRKGRAACALAN